MRLKDIILEKNCPDWLKSKDICVCDEDLLIDNNGNVIWKNGRWKNGTWEDGRWENGTWKNGRWEDGTWENGIKRVGVCKWDVYYNHIKMYVSIGCKTKTVKEWEVFFNSSEVIETQRNTNKFKNIYKSFLIAKSCIEIERENYEV